MRTNNFHYNMIKGRVAEAIIKELLQVNGYRVYNYGMENSVPDAVENIKYQNSNMAYTIRHMPDFLVQNIESGELNYVEVKYRVRGKFTIKDIQHNPYKSTLFIIVSKDAIQYISYEDLERGSTLPSTNRDLEHCEIFKIDPVMLNEYKGYAKAFFEGVR